MKNIAIFVKRKLFLFHFNYHFILFHKYESGNLVFFFLLISCFYFYYYKNYYLFIYFAWWVNFTLRVLSHIVCFKGTIPSSLKMNQGRGWGRVGSLWSWHQSRHWQSFNNAFQSILKIKGNIMYKVNSTCFFPSYKIVLLFFFCY